MPDKDDLFENCKRSWNAASPGWLNFFPDSQSQCDPVPALEYSWRLGDAVIEEDLLSEHPSSPLTDEHWSELSELYGKAIDKLMWEQFNEEFLLGFPGDQEVLESVDLNNPVEALFANAIGIGYMAGLSGRNVSPFYPYGEEQEAWRRGRRQGIEHRAKCHEQDEPLEKFTRKRLEAVSIRQEIFSCAL